jgi:electron transfer flavoprotein alpha subunit
LPSGVFDGDIADVVYPTLLNDRVVAVLRSDEAGRLSPAAPAVVQAATKIATLEPATLAALLLTPPDETCQRHALGQLRATFSGLTVLLVLPESGRQSTEIVAGLVGDALRSLPALPRACVGEPWAEGIFADLGSGTAFGSQAFRIQRITAYDDQVVLESVRDRGKLVVRQSVSHQTGVPKWITLAENAQTDATTSARAQADRSPGDQAVERWRPRQERFYLRDDIRRLLQELHQETGLARLTDADFIIDVGYGVASRDGYEAVIEPLERGLRELGVRNLSIGGSRKVTEELHLLPADRQIGQSGVRVNPVVLLAIGISGAPQHLNYIGPRATILAFNRDADAPLMTLNQRQAAPRVFGILGNLFETVPAFIQALKRESPAPEQRNDSPKGQPELNRSNV